MDTMFSNKVNFLKALAIMLVVSGHLEFSLIPMFPPYSFQLALFFFISGILFKDKYLLEFKTYFIKRVKSLLAPYFLYAAAYLGITFLFLKLTGKFWAMPITLKNELLMPFLTGHQIDLISPMWFVPQLFISLMTFFVFIKLIKSKYFALIVSFTLALFAIYLSKYSENLYILLLLRTLFSLFFLYLGYFYKNFIQGKHNILTINWILPIIALQSLLWLTNKDFTPMDGIGLSYILVWGQFDDWIVPIITSITGIWISLFLVDVFYDFIKDNSFLKAVGQNTYHIMANHLLVFNILTYFALFIKGIPFDINNAADIYWFYFPVKTTYFYFVIGMIITTYFGVFLKNIKAKLARTAN